MKRILALLLLVLAWSSSAEAANRYLKAGCANNGTGAAPGCASSGGGAGAWNSVDNANTGWAAVCAPDDILYIQARDDGTETIANNNNGDHRWQGGLSAQCSGTSGHPVRIAPYPGDIARLANGPVGCAWAACHNATLTSDGKSYVQFGSTDGLYSATTRLVVRGAVIIHGTGAQTGHVISGLEITDGWEDQDDGNWAGIRVEDITAPWIHHNYIHDIVMTATAINASSGTAIKIYRSPGSIVEYNKGLRVCDTLRCGPDGVHESQAGGIDDKDGSVNNTLRYNFLSAVPVCIRFQNQGVTATGSQAYGNVCERGSVNDGGGHGAIVTEAGSIRDILVHHNTISGWGLGFVLKAGFTIAGGYTVRDNILAAVSGGDPANRNFFDDGSSFALSHFNAATNFNAYDSNAGWQVDGNSATLAAWRTASSRDGSSHAEAGGCTFTAGTDTNYHLSGGPCATGSSTGGEQGAYGVNTCVGHLCGASGGGAAPTVTSLSPNSGTTSGGTSTTITGTGFVSGATVTFGGTSASCSFSSSTALSCTSPAHAAGAVNVVVTNPDAQTGTGVAAFTYTTTSAVRKPFRTADLAPRDPWRTGGTP